MLSSMKMPCFVCAVGLALSMLLLAGDVAAETTEKAEYTLMVEVGPDPLKADSPGTYRLAIAPKGDYTFKSETPFKMKLEAGDGVTLDQAEFKNSDLADADTGKKIETTFKAKSGQHEIQASVTFFLCTEEMCKRFKEKAALKVAAQ